MAKAGINRRGERDKTTAGIRMGQSRVVRNGYEERRRLRRLIGCNVAWIREGREMPKCLLCSRADVSRPTLDKVEAGRNTTLNTLVKIARALGVGVADLADENPQRRMRTRQR